MKLSLLQVVVIAFAAVSACSQAAAARVDSAAASDLRAQIQAHMQAQAPRSQITVGSTAGIDQMTPCTDEPRFKAYGSGTYRDVRVSCPSQGWQLYVSIEVHESTQVVVASHDLQAGVKLERSDLKAVSSASLSRDVGGTARQIKGVVGQTLAAPAASGTPIRLTSLNAAVSVHAGQSVNVHVVSGRTRIKTLAVAKQQGRVGQVILVENPTSGKRYRVKVTPQGLVADLGR